MFKSHILHVEQRLKPAASLVSVGHWSDYFVLLLNILFSFPQHFSLKVHFLGLE